MVVPPQELPILEALIGIRMKLTKLKKDRTEYIRAPEVMSIYEDVIKQVDKLNVLRDPNPRPIPQPKSSSSKEGTPSGTPDATPSASTSSLPTTDTSRPSDSLSPLNSGTTVSSDDVPLSDADVSTPGAVLPGDNEEDPKIITTSVVQRDAVEKEKEKERVEKGGKVEKDVVIQPPDDKPFKPENTNRVDTILSEVFQLLSLFFLVIGKSKEAPATYCQLLTMKRLLDHMNESGIYTGADLKPFRSRLQEFKEIVRGSEMDDESRRSDPLVRILIRKLDMCEHEINLMLASLSVLDVELVPLHQRLIQIRRQLTSIAAKPRPSKTEIEGLWEELKQIDSKREDGKFMTDSSDTIPDGQAILGGLLEENFDICQDIAARQEEVALPLQPIYDRLNDLRAQLERLVLTHRWTLRETDLYNFQVSLSEIDGMRVDGKFRDADGNTPGGQRVLLYLLRRCYGLLYRLVNSSEPISEELVPIANKLTTIKRCLLEVAKYGGVTDFRELYPYQMALFQIDQMRVDGKFLGRDGSIPEGQAILAALLSECHEIMTMLRDEIE